MIPTIDFETYSAAGFYKHTDGKIKGLGHGGRGGLPVVGTPAYAEHPSTEILCLSYDMHDGLGVRSWIPGTPQPAVLLMHVAKGGAIEAHNVTFELNIWNAVGVRRHGWPPLNIEQCRCSAARARRFSLPGALAKASAALGTVGKDPGGGRLIQKLSRPHTPTKNRPADRWTTATAWEDFKAMYAYCDQDVIAEDALGAQIPLLSEHEQAIHQADLHVNARGVQVDVQTLDAALLILKQAETKYNAELSDLTGGAVTAATQLPALQSWLSSEGVYLENMQKATIDEVVSSGRVSGRPLRALQIRQLLGSANVKKLHTLKLQTSADGRLRDQYMYCGADRTGRWSAGGVQLQNMTAKGPDAYLCPECGAITGQVGWNMGECLVCNQWVTTLEPVEWGPEAMEWAIAAIRTGDLAIVERYWGDNPVEVLCGCLRGLFIAPEGKDLICVDFSAIEAVVAACLARCQWRIDVFSGHGKIYEQSAANATGIPFEEILAHKTEHGSHHPARKTIGKVRELAGGYGGWVNAWKNFGADEFMTDEEIKVDVLKWRAESPEIVEMWGGQYIWCGPGKWDYVPGLHGLEGAAIQAILNPGQYFSHIDITYAVFNDILYCRLPSGRFLHYHSPELQLVPDKLNRGDCYQITFEGYNSNSAKGPVGWYRMETYGGRLFENVCQAVARDIQADALLRCEAADYPVVMHTHDELTAEVLEGAGTVEHMAELMTTRPDWAAWWPIRADGWRAKRYGK